jgi:hypothetical protein
MHDSDHTRQTTTGIKTLDSNNSDPNHPSITHNRLAVVEPVGIEPTTSSLQSWRSPS